jgi:hypothetical protein
MAGLLATGATPCNNQEFYDLYNQFLSVTALNEREADAICKQLEPIALRNLYGISLCLSPTIWGPSQPWLKNRWCFAPDDHAYMQTLTRCWIDQDLKYKITGIKPK